MARGSQDNSLGQRFAWNSAVGGSCVFESDRADLDTNSYSRWQLQPKRWDSLPNRDTSKHAHAGKHPVIPSAEIGEPWLRRYPDDEMADY